MLRIISTVPQSGLKEDFYELFVIKNNIELIAFIIWNFLINIQRCQQLTERLMDNPYLC